MFFSCPCFYLIVHDFREAVLHVEGNSVIFTSVVIAHSAEVTVFKSKRSTKRLGQQCASSLNDIIIKIPR